MVANLFYYYQINSHLKVNYSDGIIKFYGITKDFNTNNFMMVMEYAENGNLRRNLNKNFNSSSWKDKFHHSHYINAYSHLYLNTIDKMFQINITT